ncbi:uncharacterized protein LOC129943410 isoform X1 [Eupeodes corollae]|uniref:uncharacterized protein LOC129943410 isoform X1 n=1 Tax=Eupeodes corollae TaxID=290404 RepID=UPI002492E3A6|nr:uncharacterized protein LOC129943410 isoform X1 [Eupeodes corollae]XP_055908810.1 uncharacterized protein LOC129943410 isoform X1 [Eupeodes corollae]XP_055908811.1 uncharacterized protein LOC129943410 isoform X1 [Eupeodes corollae]XP_055908812.1 uncharacterized protein LOC129943410 isoform X1 [Eupeodes corollae]XP_055908813.1 uncharacterized protein LOC129943410 isoform X1 [Eupeodes corollae]XP_055908814.1 uncharacterized protein LOC129943410 isoform X1 [Eupeodes corollae]XP_055908815.1 un
MECFKCNVFHASFQTYVQHLKHKHKYVNIYKCQKCNEERSFIYFNSFKKHISKHFMNPLDKFAKHLGEKNTHIIPHNTIDVENPFQTGGSLQNISINILRDNANLELISNLYKKNSICKKDVQYIVTAFDAYFNSDFLKTLFKGVNKSYAQAIQNPFKHISTEYKRINMLRENGLYFSSSSATIGNRLDYTNLENRTILQNITVKEKYISLKRYMIVFLENSSVFDHIMEYINELKLETNSVSNVMQTAFWKEKVTQYSPQCIVLPLLVYFDDFEVNNPLGSRNGYQKIGGVYVSFPFLSPLYRSKLENIFVTLLFHTLDKKAYGNSVFRPLIDELKDLEINPLKISNKQVFFVLVSCIGDNLGLNSMLGFTESFSCNFFCRICKMQKSDAQTAITENPFLIRNPKNYADDLKKHDVKKTGILSSCIFNELRNFHVCRNFSVDLLHDLYEGICGFETAFILHSFIKNSKYFTLEILNNRIIGFFYGRFEGLNKPQELSMDNLKNHKLRYSASELIWFMKYLPLIISDLVPESDILWNFFLILKEIIELLFLESIDEQIISCLENLIRKHHTLYLTHFKMPLRPKHHFLTHYPFIMRKFGPLKQFWVMRHEAKHKELKQIANSTRSRINICHTIAERIQLSFFQSKFQNDFENKIISGKEIKCFNPFNNISVYIAQLKNLDSNTKFCKWTAICDIKIKIGMVIEFNNIDNIPCFGLVELIGIVREANIFCICKLLKTMFFDRHNYAFLVEKTNLFKIIEFKLNVTNIRSIILSDRELYVT